MRETARKGRRLAWREIGLVPIDQILDRRVDAMSLQSGGFVQSRSVISFVVFPLAFPIAIAALTILAFLAAPVVATAACVGSTCSLGGQMRTQVGIYNPFPISLAPPGTGDLRWGQPGQIQATSNATIQQGPAGTGLPSTDPRSLMIVKPGVFTYDEATASLELIQINPYLFVVQTNLNFDYPHPGTTGMGATALLGPFSTQTLAAGGRTGPAIVSWCAGLPPPTASFNPGCSAPDGFGFAADTTGGQTNITYPRTNGLIRYTATRNQFGGAARTRALGTVVKFYNPGALVVGDLPCTIGTNSLCLVAIESVQTPTQGVVGGKFAQMVTHPVPIAMTGVFEASIGADGTVHSVGAAAVDSMGNPIPFTGQATTSWGFPGTTSQLTNLGHPPLLTANLHTRGWRQPDIQR
jgi:hypothetical protein